MFSGSFIFSHGISFERVRLWHGGLFKMWSQATAEMWCEPKPYPPSVMTVVAQKPLGEVIAWQQGCECALCLLQDWCWATSEHLNEDRRILLRTMKAAVVDFAILLRAATWKRQNGGEDLPESGMIPA